MKIEGGLDVQQPRFVLLKHTLPPDSSRESHWDLMFELKTGLLTLELQALPEDSDRQQETCLAAIRLPDHRLHYLDFEGEVSEHRGFVSRKAAGNYHEASTTAQSNSRRFTLHGPQLEAVLEFELGQPGDSMPIMVLYWNQVAKP